MNNKADEYRELLETANEQLRRCKLLSKILFTLSIMDLIIMLILINKPEMKTMYFSLSICFIIFMICRIVVDGARHKLLLKRNSFTKKIFEIELKSELSDLDEKSEEERNKALQRYATRLFRKYLKIDDFTTMGKEVGNIQKKNKEEEEKK